MACYGAPAIRNAGAKPLPLGRIPIRNDLCEFAATKQRINN
jgi:hypothetical protein